MEEFDLVQNTNDLFETLANITRPAQIDEEEEELSDCCGAPIVFHDVCSECKEHV